VGLGCTAAAAAPPLPAFFDKRAADTKALGNRLLRFCPGFQRCDDPVTQVLRVGFHTQDYRDNGPYKQLQPALFGLPDLNLQLCTIQTGEALQSLDINVGALNQGLQPTPYSARCAPASGSS
jgi:hypothetical protein